MAIKSEEFRFPTGRLVGGSLYKPKDKDKDGKPLETPLFGFGIAIPKGPEAAHGPMGWAYIDGTAQYGGERWGNIIWAIAHQGHPQAGQMRDFAFKVTDGDSAVLNSKGKAPKDQTGYPGHWVIWFGGTFPPNMFMLSNGQPVADPHENATQPGDYVQVFGSVKYNDSTQSPGVYLNYSMVCRIGYGERIAMSADPTKAGFGGPLPAGASAMPVGNANMAPPPGSPASPPISAPPAAALPPMPPGTASPPAPAASTPVPVTPNPGILTPPPGNVPPAPGAAAAPPVPPRARTMTALAEGRTYETFIQGGWTDQMMIEHGYMLP